MSENLDLKIVKTRYEGHCSRCNREIKKDWEVYFSPNTKAVYCKPCGQVLLNEPETVPDNINLIAKIDDLKLDVSALMKVMLNIREKLDIVMVFFTDGGYKSEKKPEKKLEKKPVKKSSKK